MTITCDICDKKFEKESGREINTIAFIHGGSLKIESVLCDECLGRIIAMYPKRYQEILNGGLKEKVPENRILIDYDIKDADGKLTNSLHKIIELPKKKTNKEEK